MQLMLPFRLGARREVRGLSIAEVLVASGVLLLLFAAISQCYYTASQVWRKVDLRTSLLRELQVVARYLERGLEVSHPFGLARADNALAYLSASDEDNQLQLSDLGRPEWQRYIIVYVDGEDRLRRREVPLSPTRERAPTFQEVFGTTLAGYLAGGPQTGDRYLTHSGRILRLDLENSGDYGSLFQLTIVAERMRNSTETEELILQTKVSLRN